MSWRDEAACRDMDPRMFISRNPGEVYSQRLREVCHGCPSQTECLRHAFKFNEVGLWGGTTEQERVAYRKALGVSYAACPHCGTLTIREGNRGGFLACDECNPRQAYFRVYDAERRVS